jgi:predicted RNA-binding Zn-ribbon protein involved in translation (DUF1610 family)
VDLDDDTEGVAYWKARSEDLIFRVSLEKAADVFLGRVLDGVRYDPALSQLDVGNDASGWTSVGTFPPERYPVAEGRRIPGGAPKLLRIIALCPECRSGWTIWSWSRANQHERCPRCGLALLWREANASTEAAQATGRPRRKFKLDDG